ncbi:hypothetical protein TRFO_22799 [Tritrichomonas foetus]|uniref:Uncharacterized protein n=1 Tax=Tritrichomonas foetus TaxID=1144522 RepID=A0A1J4KGZ5_9EUKA|nr:hypothetical protein TRFO_22799 [Tritrichomonas foetus]|eukprot:OHT08613.1 hypothetical protein TRFO_22799 [Tritrichomonas foetus]
MSPENLSKMMKNFPKGYAEKYSKLCVRSIEINSTEEFKQIIQEKNLEERLNTLDELVAKSQQTFNLNMSVFEFEEHDPEKLKSSIIVNAKKQEIDRLRRLLNNMNENNERLEKKNKAIQDELNDARKKIEESNNDLQQFLEKVFE